MNKESIIDWNLGLKLAGGKQDLAEEILNLLTRNLADEVTEIQIAYENKNKNELLQRIHKIHGGICYAGTPRLKKAISTLETALAQNKLADVPTLLENFVIESKLLLAAMQTTS